MNKLSWILYWADVLPSLAGAVGFVTGLLAFIGTVVMAFHVVAGCFPNDPEAAAYRSGTSFIRWVLPLVFLLCWGTYLVPSKETFYAIAASEVGEDVLKSPEVGKARQALNNWLDKQMEEPETKEAE